MGGVRRVEEQASMKPATVSQSSSSTAAADGEVVLGGVPYRRSVWLRTQGWD